MKNSILSKFSLALLMIFCYTVSKAQLLTNNGQQSLITNSNVILDGSTNFSTEAGAAPYIGKGIIIPSVDLVNLRDQKDELFGEFKLFSEFVGNTMGISKNQKNDSE